MQEGQKTSALPIAILVCGIETPRLVLNNLANSSGQVGLLYGASGMQVWGQFLGRCSSLQKAFQVD